MSIGIWTMAQQNENSISYKEVLNDPYHIPNVELKISPVWMNMSLMNLMSIGWGIGTDISITQKIKLDANFNTTYTDKFFHFGYMNLNSSDIVNYDYTHKNYSNLDITQDVNKYYSVDAGISIVFNDKDRISKDRVILSAQQSRYGNVNVINSEVTYVDSKIRRRWLARVGFQRSNDIYNPWYMASDIDMYLTDDEGNNFFDDGIQYVDVDYPEDEYSVNGKEYTLAGDEYEYYEGWVTNVTTNIISVGVSREIIRNFIIDVENYGKRGNRRINRVYFDVLFGDVNVDPFVFFDSNPSGLESGTEMGTQVREYRLQGDEEHNIQTNNFGFRVGFESHGISPTKLIPWAEQDEATKAVNFGYKTELGLNPGIKGKGLYFSLGIYLALNGKI